jgi:uncharacterized protein (DUF924 family)
MDIDNILDYWFSEHMSRHWFNSTAEIDADIKTRFESVWELARQGKLDSWASSANGSLALIIILDQLPLNMFRGQAESFSTEAKAIAIARQAIQSGFDRQIDGDRLVFMYMPFMHSEDLQDQDYAVQLYEAAGLQENVKFAMHHRDIVQRFGRFPHRNAALGRVSSEAETAYMNSDEAFKG